MPTIRTPHIAPCLWFDKNAEEAANFYTAIFPDSRIRSVSHYPPGSYMPADTVMLVDFELSGRPFMALNGGPHFTFNKAVSFFVSCDTQAEIDYFWDRLSADGGKPVQCGWVDDRFGLSWQIVPAELPQLIARNRERVMNALWQMTKLDLAALRAAADGPA